MTRTRLLVAALLAFAGSVALTPDRPERAQTLLSAVSQSLGGMRVFIVDVLYLRAERARAMGDINHARNLFETLLQMQPDNAPAAARLVGVEFDLLRYEIDDDKRFERWKTLRRLLGEVIELRPGSARLRHRDAQLILKVLRGEDASLSRRVTDWLGTPRYVALTRLAEAAMLADVIPLVGSSHLDAFAFLAVEVAADALVRGDRALYESAVQLGRAVLAERAETLRLHRYSKVAGADPLDPEAWVRLNDLLAWGLDTVEAVAASPGTPEARKAVADFELRVGDDLKSLPLLRAAAGED